jgi:hypothetical protein
MYGCGGAKPTPPAPRVIAVEDNGPPLFEDMTKASGVDFSYRNGEDAGHLAILESLGGGVALIDYDRDGLLDLFLPGGGYYDGKDKKQIKGHPSKLYKNLGNWKFKDVTAEVGLDKQALFFTHGAAVGDYDCDGWPDLLVTGWGRVALYHNEKGRRFVEVTKQAGLNDNLWSSSAGWADLDGDGYPELYVCHYANWSFDNHPPCSYDGKTPDVCPPKTFTALPHVLYHNNRNGTFTDVSKSAGLRMPRTEKDYEQLRELPDDARDRLRRADKEKEYGKGLGVLLVDVNADGKPDIYVANDTVDNFLYINRSKPGKLLFEEVGMGAGVARDGHGQPNGSMGLDAGDCDGSGRPSIWVTNYENELHALYHNDCSTDAKGEHIVFRFFTEVAGIAAIGQAYVGWGTNFVDMDLDGWPDLFVVNGHAIRFPKGKATRAQRPVLLLNQGKGRFRDISGRGGPYCQTEHVGRGAAFGDIDNDGRVDIVICNVNQPTALLRGIGGEGHHWLGIELETKSNRSPVGTVITLAAGGREQTRYGKGGGSYASAHDPRHLFGLGTTDKIDKLTVTWPSGQKQEWQTWPWTAIGN